jgi:hypothetical protein
MKISHVTFETKACAHIDGQLENHKKSELREILPFVLGSNPTGGANTFLIYGIMPWSE